MEQILVNVPLINDQKIDELIDSITTIVAYFLEDKYSKMLHDGLRKLSKNDKQNYLSFFEDFLDLGMYYMENGWFKMELENKDPDHLIDYINNEKCAEHGWSFTNTN